MAPSDECSWLLYLSRAGRCGGDGEPHHRDLTLFAAAFLPAFVVPALLLLGRYWWTRRGDPLGIAGAILGPRELPVVGSMVLMAGLSHRNLAKVAAAVGRLARRRLMAPFLGETADPDVARELPAGAALADRLAKESAYRLLFHRAIGFAPHVVWRALRRVASAHLFPPRQVAASASEHAVIAGQMVPAMAREAGGGATVVARRHLKRASLHNVMWSVFSRGYDDNKLPPANAVVAADGSGDYTSISAAIAAAPRMSANRYVIHVKEGVYKEFVTISKDIWNITLVGDGMDKTVISGSRCCADGYNTAETAIVSVDGNGFIAQDLAIENTAGPRMTDGQAVALMLSSDCSVVYHCALRSFQDTLFARQRRHFYRECQIAGTVDFVFGDASAVFQRCTILARLPLSGQQNTITAQGRDTATDNTGFVFQRCTVVADDDLSHAQATVETYLGRPWKAFSRTIFMESTISNIIDPKGWLPWEREAPPDNLYYAEYNNNSPGADVSGRVDWHGFHVIHDATEADAFTVARFINGNDWLPSTGVVYTPGL